MQKTISRILCAVLVCAMLASLVFGGAAFQTAQAESATSGRCGADLWWYFDASTGILTIQGSGTIWDYDLPELTPWWSFAGSIHKIVFTSGVTVIGKNAFAGCAVETVEFPDTLTTIKEGAFQNCTQLVEVDASETVLTSIEAKAFAGCDALAAEAVQLPETVTYVADTAFDEPVTQPTTPAPVESNVVVKTYTSRDHATVTETWESGVLVKKVMKYPYKNREVVYTDFNENACAQTITTTIDGEADTRVERTYDELGRLVKEVTLDSEGNLQETMEIAYTSETEGVFKTSENWGWTSVESSGWITLHENGTIKSKEYDDLANHSNQKTEYDEDGIIVSSSRVDLNCIIVSSYVDGVLTEQVTYGEDGEVVAIMTCESTPDGIPVKDVCRNVKYSYSWENHYDELGFCSARVITYDDGSRYCWIFDRSGKDIGVDRYDAEGNLVYSERYDSYIDEETGYRVYVTTYLDGTKETVVRDPEDFNHVISSTKEYQDELGSHRVVTDGDGHIIEETHQWIDEDGNHCGSSYVYRDETTGNQITESVDEFGRETYMVKDESGVLLEEKVVFHDVDGEWTSTFHTVRDEETGNYIREVTSYNGSHTVTVEDKNGNLIKEDAEYHDFDGTFLRTEHIEVDQETGEKYVESVDQDGNCTIVVTDKDGNIVYQDEYQKTVTKDENGNTVTVQVYPNGTVTTVTDKNGNQVSLTTESVDEQGRSYVRTTDRHGNCVYATEYDEEGNLKVYENEWVYDEAGNLVSGRNVVHDGNGTIYSDTSFTVDQQTGNRIEESRNAQGLRVQTVYDAAGNILTLYVYAEDGVTIQKQSTFEMTEEGRVQSSIFVDGSREKILFGSDNSVTVIAKYADGGMQVHFTDLNGNQGETVSLSADGTRMSVMGGFGETDENRYEFCYLLNQQTGEWEEVAYFGSGIHDVNNGGSKPETSQYAPTVNDEIVQKMENAFADQETEEVAEVTDEETTEASEETTEASEETTETTEKTTETTEETTEATEEVTEATEETTEATEEVTDATEETTEVTEEATEATEEAADVADVTEETEEQAA